MLNQIVCTWFIPNNARAIILFVTVFCLLQTHTHIIHMRYLNRKLAIPWKISFFSVDCLKSGWEYLNSEECINAISSGRCRLVNDDCWIIWYISIHWWIVAYPLWIWIIEWENSSKFLVAQSVSVFGYSNCQQRNKLKEKSESENENASEKRRRQFIIIQALYSFNRISKYFLHRLVHSISHLRTICSTWFSQKTSFRKNYSRILGEIIFSPLCP